LTAVMLAAVCSAAVAVALVQPPVGPGPYPLSYKLKLPKGEHASSLMVLP
jgi:hypothetical protein